MTTSLNWKVLDVHGILDSLSLHLSYDICAAKWYDARDGFASNDLHPSPRICSSSHSAPVTALAHFGGRSCTIMAQAWSKYLPWLFDRPRVSPKSIQTQRRPVVRKHASRELWCLLYGVGKYFPWQGFGSYDPVLSLQKGHGVI